MTPADDPDSPRRATWWALLPGLLLATGLALLAWVAGAIIPAVGGPVFGIVLGMCVRAAWQRPPLFAVGLDFAGTYVLQASVVVLGLAGPAPRPARPNRMGVASGDDRHVAHRLRGNVRLRPVTRSAR